MFGLEPIEIMFAVLILYIIGGKSLILKVASYLPLPPALSKALANGNGNGELKTMMAELKSHYNEDTTQALKEIKEAVKEHHEEEMPVLKEMNERLAILVDRKK